MTPAPHVETPDNLVRAFRSHLTGDLAAHAHPTAAITRAVWVAVNERGWTPRELAAECATALDNTRPGAVITHRLRQAADGTRPKPTDHPAFATFTQPKPWCRSCDDPRTRFVDVEKPDGSTAVRRCPRCYTRPPEAKP
jgi:hypothetical protein